MKTQRQEEVAVNESLFVKIVQAANQSFDVDVNSRDIVFEDTNIYVSHKDDAVTIPVIRRVGSNPDKVVSSICCTRSVTAKSVVNFIPMRQCLTFDLKEKQKFIRLELTKKDFQSDDDEIEFAFDLGVDENQKPFDTVLIHIYK